MGGGVEGLCRNYVSFRWFLCCVSIALLFQGCTRDDIFLFSSPVEASPQEKTEVPEPESSQDSKPDEEPTYSLETPSELRLKVGDREMIPFALKDSTGKEIEINPSKLRFVPSGENEVFKIIDDTPGTIEGIKPGGPVSLTVRYVLSDGQEIIRKILVTVVEKPKRIEVSATIDFEIVEADADIEGRDKVPVGETFNLVATYTDQDGLELEPDSWDWKSSDPSVLEVDPKTGVITAKKVGNATITLVAVFEGKEITSNNVLVNVFLPKLRITNPIEKIKLKGTHKLGFSFTLGDEAETELDTSLIDVSWSSEDTDVLEVDDGNLAPVAYGTTTILIETEYKGQPYEDSIEVRVYGDAVLQIKGPDGIRVEETKILTWEYTDEDGEKTTSADDSSVIEVAWEISNGSDKASLNQEPGTITGVSEGVVILKASVRNQEVTDEKEIEVIEKLATKLDIGEDTHVVLRDTGESSEFEDAKSLNLREYIIATDEAGVRDETPDLEWEVTEGVDKVELDSDTGIVKGLELGKARIAVVYTSAAGIKSEAKEFVVEVIQVPILDNPYDKESTRFYGIQVTKEGEKGDYLEYYIKFTDESGKEAKELLTWDVIEGETFVEYAGDGYIKGLSVGKAIVEVSYQSTENTKIFGAHTFTTEVYVRVKEQKRNNPPPPAQESSPDDDPPTNQNSPSDDSPTNQNSPSDDSPTNQVPPPDNPPTNDDPTPDNPPTNQDPTPDNPPTNQDPPPDNPPTNQDPPPDDCPSDAPILSLDNNGGTVKSCNCEPSVIGKPHILPETGEEYVIVDKDLLEKMVNEGKYEDLTKVCTTCVKGMLWYLFVDNRTFNQDISEWDTSGVTSMNSMFAGARSFNQDIGNWDVSNVIDMNLMFHRAENFNQDIGDWNVSNVKFFAGMFAEAENFNQDIGDWDVSSASDEQTPWGYGNVGMNAMFDDASAFNQDIGDWDLSDNVQILVDMFRGASAFNQDISGWDVSNVTEMGYMFEASVFDQDIGDWDVSNVTGMTGMFSRAENFDQDISEWDVSRVVNCREFSDNTSSAWAQSEKPTFINCTP